MATEASAWPKSSSLIVAPASPGLPTPLRVRLAPRRIPCTDTDYGEVVYSLVVKRDKAGQPTAQAARPSELSGQEALLSERLSWLEKIGWRLAFVYAVAFIGFAGFLLTWHLPRELGNATSHLATSAAF